MRRTWVRPDTVRGIVIIALFLWVLLPIGRKAYSYWTAKSLARATQVRISAVLHTLPDSRTPVLGDSKARFKIVEFSDYQCPFCKAIDPVLATFAARHPGDVALYRYDTPLEQIHSYAYKAAVAAGCAEMQGIQSSFQSTLFQHQREFATIDWAALAKDAGVPNSQTFTQCVSAEGPRERIRKDIETGNLLGIEGTPSFVINGAMISGPLSDGRLNDLYAKFESSLR